MGAVNCEEQQGLCQQEGVEGYPTIRGYINGQAHEFSGGRSAAALKEFALGLIPNKVVALSSKRALEALLKDCGGGARSGAAWGLCLVLVTDKRETSPLYRSLSSQYAGNVVFGEIRAATSGGGAALAAELGVKPPGVGGDDALPALVAICNGDLSLAERYEGAGGMKSTSLKKFVNQFASGKRCKKGEELLGRVGVGLERGRVWVRQVEGDGRRQARGTCRCFL